VKRKRQRNTQKTDWKVFQKRRQKLLETDNEEWGEQHHMAQKAQITNISRKFSTLDSRKKKNGMREEKHLSFNVHFA
jgi:hypothetical protein